MNPATILLLIVVDLVLFAWAIRNLATRHPDRWRRRRSRRCGFVSAGRVCIREPHPPGSNHVFPPRSHLSRT